MNFLDFLKFEPLKSRLKIIRNSALVIGIILALFSWYLTLPAVFVIEDQIIKFTEPIIIKAGNFKADRQKCLNVMFDGKLHENQAFPKKSIGRQVWYFMLKDQNYLPGSIKAGNHKIKVGFPGDLMSEEFSIKLKKHVPQFIIMNPLLRSDAIIKIKADNNEANVKKELHVEIDSILFPESGLPVERNERQIWHCNLRNLKLTEDMKKNGKHKIRLRFPGGNFSKEFTIVFITQGFVVNTELKRKDNVNIFRGKAAGKSQIEDNNFQVDVIIYHEGPDKEISVPIHRKKDEDTGIIYYEFETKFAGFPEISPDNEKFDQPFFEFRITDKAGNQYRQQQSYAQFIAPGSILSASNDWADIKINKKLPKDQASNLLINIFSLYPSKQIRNDNPAIQLTVTCKVKNIRHLKWKSNNYRAMTLIYRNGEKIATSDTDEYIDEDAKAKQSVSYSVVIKNEKGYLYTSNTVRSDAPLEQSASENRSNKNSNTKLDLSELIDKNVNFDNVENLVPGRKKIYNKSPAEEKYYQTANCYKTLRKYPSKQQHRSEWIKCIESSEAIYNLEPNGSWATSGLYLTGHLYDRLYRHTMEKNDYQEAEKNFNSLLKKHPGSKYRERTLNSLSKLHDKNPTFADYHTECFKPQKKQINDVAKEKEAREKYFKAENCSKNIIANASETEWLRCVQRFREVYQCDPEGQWAAPGLFQSALLYQKLYNITKKQKYADRFESLLKGIIRNYPENIYCDKAAYAIEEYFIQNPPKEK